VQEPAFRVVKKPELLIKQ